MFTRIRTALHRPLRAPSIPSLFLSTLSAAAIALVAGWSTGWSAAPPAGRAAAPVRIAGSMAPRGASSLSATSQVVHAQAPAASGPPGLRLWVNVVPGSAESERAWAAAVGGGSPWSIIRPAPGHSTRGRRSGSWT